MLDSLRLYFKLAQLSFSRQLVYRQAALWGLITNLFFGVLRIAVLLAWLRQPGASSPLSVSQAITYVALTQMFISAFTLFGWTEFMRSIHRGEVVSELLRPQSTLGLWAAQDAGRALGQFLLRGLPMWVLFWLLWRVNAPEQWLLTGLSVLLAWACGFFFRFWINCAAFWTADAVGIGRLAWAVLGLGCGFLLPLALFPEWFKAALHWTPFPSMLNTIVELWLGLRTGPAAWQALGQQLGWAALLWGLAQWTLQRGLKRLEVAGG